MSEHFLDKIIAFVRRDFLTATRYRAGFALSSVSAIAQLATFYYLSRAVGTGFRPQGMAYFPFLLIGTGFYTFLIMGVNDFLSIVQQAQQGGTLEVLMTTSTPGPSLVLLSAVSAFAGNALQFWIFIATGLLLSGGLGSAPNLVGCAFVFLLSSLIAVAMGMFAASVQLAIQKGSAITWAMSACAWLMTGALFPVGTLPRPLRLLSQAIPFTHSLNAMRLALLQSSGSAGLWREVFVLAAFTLVLFPLGVLAFSRTLRAAREAGTLSFY